MKLNKMIMLYVIFWSAFHGGFLYAKESAYTQLHKEQAVYFEGITERQGCPVSFEFVDEPLFAFALIADTHTGTRDMFESNAMPYRTVEMWRQINALMPAFVLHLGDMTTGWPLRGDHEGEMEYALYLDKTHSRVPVHYTPGNHDIGNKVSQNDHHVEGEFAITGEKINLYRRWFGADYYSFHHKGYRIICINTQLFNSTLKENELQWQWLKTELEQAQADKGIFVFTHYPLFLNTPETDPGPLSYEVIDEPDRTKLIELFRQSNVNIVFSGHTHWPVNNYMPDIEFHAFYSANFTRAFFERDLDRQFYDVKGAWRFNPYKVGYAVARVYQDKTVTQFVQSYPRLPEVEKFQLNNASDIYRAMPRNASELNDSSIGTYISIPEISKERRLDDRNPSALDDSWLTASKNMKGKPEGPLTAARDYTIPTPIEFSAQQGVKRMIIKEVYTPGKMTNKKMEELNRFLRLGVPPGVELVLPLSLDLEMAGKLDLSGFTAKVSTYQILDKAPDGRQYSSAEYGRLVEAVRERMKEQGVDAALAGYEMKISSGEEISRLAKLVDVVVLAVDVDTVAEKEYYEAIAEIEKNVSGNCGVWVRFTGSGQGQPPLEPVSLSSAKLMHRIFAFNKDKNIYSFVDSRTHSSLSMLNNDYDPTFLYYGVGAFNTITGCEFKKINAADRQIRIDSDNVEYSLYEGSTDDIYLMVSGKNIGEKPHYADISLKYSAASAYYFDTVTGTVQELNLTRNGELCILPKVCVPDHPVFIKIKN